MIADLPEMVALERIIDEGAAHLDVRQLCEIDIQGRRFPIYAIALGNADRDVPAVGFFGGIHGLERIGAEVLLVFLRSLLARLPWDIALRRQLESVRLIFVPLVNPGGMLHSTRCNPRGVDLMRNAPLESTERVPFMLGGQRLSRYLPWFRGGIGEPMEAEARAVCQIVEEELLSRQFSIALDCHSGFGMSDRIWFPYAHTVMPIKHLPEIHALMSLYDQTYPHHNYVFEPQSCQYLAHGDLWDFLYKQSIAREDRIFLPVTLEMGSWLWVKKNPRQIFSRQGIFNPLPLHRLQRVLRRHLLWLDFVTRAACGFGRWLPREDERMRHNETALARWYRRSMP